LEGIVGENLQVFPPTLLAVAGELKPKIQSLAGRQDGAQWVDQDVLRRVDNLECAGYGREQGVLHCETLQVHASRLKISEVDSPGSDLK
jgi:hypothetical protein